MRNATGLLVLLAATVVAGAAEPPAPPTRADLDKRIRKAAHDAAAAGTHLFNDGDHEGCCRLYEGAIVAILPLLADKSFLADSVRFTLAEAKGREKLVERAFVLRRALDDVMFGGADVWRKPLWDRLGGQPTVEAVVHDFVAAVIADPNVNFTRGGKFKLDDAGAAKLERHLVEMFSAATGGPLKYTGRDLKPLHAGMKITEDEFVAMAMDLSAVLKKYRVPQPEVEEILLFFGSTKGDIVEVKR